MSKWAYKAERNFEHNIEIQSPPPWYAYFSSLISCNGVNLDEKDLKRLKELEENIEKSGLSYVLTAHIRDGSQYSPFLSVSKSLAISSQKHAVGTYNSKSKERVKRTINPRRNVLLIDLDKINENSIIYCDSEENCKKNGITDPTIARNACADREVIIEDMIPGDAAVVISPIISDLLFVLDQETQYTRIENSAEDFENEKQKKINELNDNIATIDKKINIINTKLDNIGKKVEANNEAYDISKENKKIENANKEKEKLEDKRSIIECEVIENYKDVLPYVIEIINEEIFNNGAKELLEIISKINFNKYEQNFIDYYYNQMQSMEETSKKLFDESNSNGFDIAQGLRCDVIRKIIQDKDVQTYLNNKIKEKYNKVWMLNDLDYLFNNELLEKFVFPVPGAVSGSAKTSIQDSIHSLQALGTGLVSDNKHINKVGPDYIQSYGRTIFPYGVDYLDNGETISLTPIYVKYNCGIIQRVEKDLGNRTIEDTTGEERHIVGDGTKGLSNENREQGEQ